MKEEIDFLIKIFVENGYDQHTLENIARSYRQPTRHQEQKNKDQRQIQSKIVSLPWVLVSAPNYENTFGKLDLKQFSSQGGIFNKFWEQNISLHFLKIVNQECTRLIVRVEKAISEKQK